MLVVIEVKILTIDVGVGTLDLLFYDINTDEHYKFVMPSPTRVFANKVKQVKDKDLIVTGALMGGGPSSRALIEHVNKKHQKVFITEESAKTIHNNLEKVKNYGIEIVNEKEAEEMINSERDKFVHLETYDLNPNKIFYFLSEFGIEPDFEVIGVAVQDHGLAPPNISSTDFRHLFMKEFMERNPRPESFLFNSNEIPDFLIRMKAVAKSLKDISAKKFLMDTCIAAILGAAIDPSVKDTKRKCSIDIGNGHTFSATIVDDELAGFFEYHTRHITPEKLEELVIRLGDGNISHKQIVEEGGHGAFIQHALGFKNIQKIVVTGPKRDMIRKTNLPVTFGTPLGDNMMTGTVGLLQAINLRLELGFEFD